MHAHTMQQGLFFYTNSLQGISRRDRSDHDGDALVSSLLVRLIIVYIILSVLCYWYSIMAILVNFRSSFKLLVLVPLSLIHVSYTLDKGMGWRVTDDDVQYLSVYTLSFDTR